MPYSYISLKDQLSYDQRIYTKSGAHLGIPDGAILDVHIQNNR